MGKWSPYRSGYESAVARDSKMAEMEYEPKQHQLKYTIEKKYLPDFVVECFDGSIFLVECKGYFRPSETAKYKAIKQQHPDLDLRFMLQNPNKPVRKGSKLTMSMWCEKYNYPWVGGTRIPLEWLKGDNTNDNTKEIKDL